MCVCVCIHIIHIIHIYNHINTYNIIYTYIHIIHTYIYIYIYKISQFSPKIAVTADIFKPGSNRGPGVPCGCYTSLLKSRVTPPPTFFFLPDINCSRVSRFVQHRVGRRQFTGASTWNRFILVLLTHQCLTPYEDLHTDFRPALYSFFRRISHNFELESRSWTTVLSTLEWLFLQLLLTSPVTLHCFSDFFFSYFLVC